MRSREGGRGKERLSVRRRPVAELEKLFGTSLSLPASGGRTHVSALGDRFLLLTLEIKIKCITKDQFSGIWYICFGDVKNARGTLSLPIRELARRLGKGWGHGTVSTLQIPQTLWESLLAGDGENHPPKEALRHDPDCLGSRNQIAAISSNTTGVRRWGKQHESMLELSRDPSCWAPCLT